MAARPCENEPLRVVPLLGSRERAEYDTGITEGAGDGGGDLRGAGSVAVDADGLRCELDFGAVVRGDDAALRDTECLADCFSWVADERVVEFARAQGAVRFVAAVGEGFGGDRKARFA